MRRSVRERFEAFYDVGPGCWNWDGQRGEKGYGIFLLNRKGAGAHRVAWTLARGPIPDGLFVLHSCDNRACVNPSHLFLGTNRDNVEDMLRKGRQPRGEAKTLAKLTEATVRALRVCRRAGFSVRSMAEVVGVSTKTVRDAINGVTWGHVI